jgi:hypothetical protein
MNKWLKKFFNIKANKKVASPKKSTYRRPIPPPKTVKPDIIKPIQSMTPLDPNTPTIEPPTVYSNAFGVLDKTMLEEKNIERYTWYTCRDSFAGVFKKPLEQFPFSHPAGTTKNIEVFFNKLENKLKLKKNRTTFLATDKPNITIVKPSLWWRKYHIRRSLFTILLRAAPKYDIEKDNFKETLYTDPYLALTKEAVKQFLKGKTLAPKKECPYGWRDAFKDKKTKEEILQILQKPPKKQPAAMEMKEENQPIPVGEVIGNLTHNTGTK